MFQQIESRWGYSGTSDKIRFIVDRRIFVVGFGLYGSIHGPSEYDVTIQVRSKDMFQLHQFHILVDSHWVWAVAWIKWDIILIRWHKCNFPCHVQRAAWNPTKHQLHSSQHSQRAGQSLWNQRVEKGHSWLSQWRESHLPVQLCSREQQWDECGGRANSRDYFLHMRLHFSFCMLHKMNKFKLNGAAWKSCSC